MIGKTNAGGGGSFATVNDAVLVVSAPAGSTVTITKSGVTKVGNGWQNSDGVNYFYYFAIKAAQFDANTPWTVLATLGNASAQTSVIIDSNNVYSVMLAYHLPIQYQEVAYLESSGIQHIDSGIKASNIKRGVIKGRLLAGSNQYASLFGACNRTDQIANGQTLAYTPHDGHFYVDNNGYQSAASISADTDFTVDFTVTSSAITMTVNGATSTTGGTVGARTADYNVWLFDCNYKNTHIIGVTARITEVQFYGYDSDDEPIADFVPCYRIADGVTGMYDTVTESFIAGSGGAFTLGPNV